MRAPTALLFLVPALLACQTMPAVDPGLKVRSDTRPQCALHCEELGMRLGAIVLIRNSAGCVCEPRDAPPRAEGPAVRDPAPARSGGAATGGGALVVALEEAALEEEAQRRKQQEDERRQREDEERRQREDDSRRRATELGHPPGTPFHR
jgi:hypothetical protein